MYLCRDKGSPHVFMFQDKPLFDYGSMWHDSEERDNDVMCRHMSEQLLQALNLDLPIGESEMACVDINICAHFYDEHGNLIEKT